MIQTRSTEIIISPELFEGLPVKAFFTGKGLGADTERIISTVGLKVESVYMPFQKHTSHVIDVDSALTPAVADAAITKKNGLMLAVQVADCVPILIYDRQRQVIGAVHAGWRGTASGILMNAIKAMVNRYSSSPSDLLIALGPSIRGCCYIVGYEVISAVKKTTGSAEYIFTRHGKYYIDLPSANRHQAITMGVLDENIWLSGICTCCEHDRFYSYRYSKDGGRQGGFIVME